MLTNNAAATTTTTSTNANKAAVLPPKSVITVGAGAASIALAYTLVKESPLDITITILEANDYVGGRVRHFDFEGHTVEMGANWISGTNVVMDNPIWKLAQAIQLQGHVSERDNAEKMLVVNVGNNNNKSMIITEEYTRQEKRFDAIFAKAMDHMKKNEKEQPSASSTAAAKEDQDVRSLLEQCGWPAKDQLSDVERAVEHNVLEVWIIDQLERLSSVHNMTPGANDVELGQDEMFVEDARGFNAIFQNMVHDLLQGNNNNDKKPSKVSVLLGQEVQSIHYGDDSSNDDDDDNNNHNNTTSSSVKAVAKDVKTGQVKEYHADIIVSTVSVGVLQSGAIQFHPPLPQWKLNAVNSIEMFCFAKVYAKFPKSVWPNNDKDYVLFVSSGEEHRGYYPLWMKYKNVVHKDSENDDTVLCMCYLGGDQAKRVEGLSTEQIKDEIEALFGKAFGNNNNSGDNEKCSCCRPLSVAVTDWSRNPRFCGSYSAFPRGAFDGSNAGVSHDDFKRCLTGVKDLDESPSLMQAAIDDESSSSSATTPKLYFAGEACDDNYNGWVQGGYLSGERVARAILGTGSLFSS